MASFLKRSLVDRLVSHLDGPHASAAEPSDGRSSRRRVAIGKTLKWSKKFCRDAAISIVDDLLPADRELVLAYMKDRKDSGRPWRWGSACSGSEPPKWVYEGFEEAFGYAELQLGCSDSKPVSRTLHVYPRDFFLTS